MEALHPADPGTTIPDSRFYESRFHTKNIAVDSLIRQVWSPEQISGLAISNEWIYLYIYQDKRQGGDLHTHLRCRKKHRKRYGTKDRRGRIPNCTSIDERPSIVVGDWEGDTIIGKGHRGGGATLVERKTQYTVLAKSKTKQAKQVGQSIEQALAPLRNRVHTITYDNGLEVYRTLENGSNPLCQYLFCPPLYFLGAWAE